MNPTTFPHKAAKPRDSYYLLTFETLADRTRWLLKHDFTFAPIEHASARWASWHNGGDFTHSLEMVPFAREHSCNPMALSLKVYLHSNGKTQPPPLRQGQRGYLKSPYAGLENE